MAASTTLLTSATLSQSQGHDLFALGFLASTISQSAAWMLARWAIKGRRYVALSRLGLTLSRPNCSGPNRDTVLLCYSNSRPCLYGSLLLAIMFASIGVTCCRIWASRSTYPLSVRRVLLALPADKKHTFTRYRVSDDIGPRLRDVSGWLLQLSEKSTTDKLLRVLNAVALFVSDARKFDRGCHVYCIRPAMTWHPAASPVQTRTDSAPVSATHESRVPDGLLLLIFETDDNNHSLISN